MLKLLKWHLEKTINKFIQQVPKLPSLFFKTIVATNSIQPPRRFIDQSLSTSMTGTHHLYPISKQKFNLIHNSSTYPTY